MATKIANAKDLWCEHDEYEPCVGCQKRRKELANG